MRRWEVQCDYGTGWFHCVYPKWKWAARLYIREAKKVTAQKDMDFKIVDLRST